MVQVTDEPQVQDEVAPAEPVGEPVRRGRGRGRVKSFGNWSVRSKLVAVVVLPVIATLVATTLLTDNLRKTSASFALDEQVSQAQSATLDLIRQLDVEQLVIAVGVSRLDGAALGLPNRAQQTAATDQAVDRVRRLSGDLLAQRPSVQGPSRVLDESMNLVDIFRSSFAAGTNATSVAPVAQAYRPAIAAALDLGEVLTESVTSQDLRSTALTAEALASANAQSNYEDLLLLAVGVNGSGAVVDSDVFAAESNRVDTRSTFRNFATPAQQRQYDAAVVEPERARRFRYAQETSATIAALPSPAQYLQVVVPADRATSDLRASISADQVASAARQSQAAVTRGSIISVIVITLLLLGLVLTFFAIRAVTRPLEALRAAALDIAGTKLPAAITRIRNGRAGAEIDVEPVGVHTTEETGQVARAFDAVHQEALRLASEQEALRRNVNDILVNLSRRSQALVGRQLSLIDRLENAEQDPDQLSQLFRLDHLASRMRRNNDNLMVLAGAGGTQSGKPLPVVDVVRAAVSETEAYTRITVQAVPAAAVSATVANDLVHLLAELLDNATNFSPPTSRVTVAVRRDFGSGLTIEVADSGVGIGPVELSERNRKLAEPPVVDSDVPRQMGLFVVSRLASRHELSVTLRPAESGTGVVAVIGVPTTALVGSTSSVVRRPGGTAALGNEQNREPQEMAPIREPATASAGNGRVFVRPELPAAAAAPVATNGNHHPAPAMGPGPAADPRERVPVPEKPRPAPVAEEMTPIFQELSAWFSGRDDVVGPATSPVPRTVAAPVPQGRSALDGPEPGTDDRATPAFVSGADDGWRAVLAVEREVAEEVTAVGLPRRRPRANLVPGSALPTRAPDARAGKHRDAEAVRGRLSSYQRGLQSGRSETRGPSNIGRATGNGGSVGTGTGGLASNGTGAGRLGNGNGANGKGNGASDGANGDGTNGEAVRAAEAGQAPPRSEPHFAARPAPQPGATAGESGAELPRRQPRSAPVEKR